MWVNWGTMRVITRPMTTNITGTLTNRMPVSCTSSRRAMITPPTIMIGAATSSVQPSCTSICTWVTSLVMRVISDGAPKPDTSRAE